MANGTAAPADAQQNKVWGVLAYIIFFLPYLVAPKSPFARYHANQGLLLLIFNVAVWLIGSFLPVIGWFVVLPIGYLLGFILFIIGIVNAAQGKLKPLPVIGRFTLIK